MSKKNSSSLMIQKKKEITVGYLSGGARVSTKPEAEEGGPRTHILGIIKGFVSCGYTVKEYIVGNRVPSSWVTKGSDNTIRKNWLSRFGVDIVRIWLSFLHRRNAWKELGGEVDFVYERFSAFQSMGSVFKKRGIPWILETNAPLFFDAKDERKATVLHNVLRSMELRAYRDCDLLVCVTNTLRDIIIKEAHVQPEKIIVLPNAVDTDVFNIHTVTPIRFFDNFTIGFVGRLQTWQKLDILLQAFSEVRKEGADISLVIVGDGVMFSEWETLARELGILNHVKFVGYVPWHSVPPYIAGFDVCYSGPAHLKLGMYLSPLKLYEYMAMAKPVIASSTEDSVTLIKEDDTGFLFRSGDIQDLKRAIWKAYNCENSMLNQMGIKAHGEITKHHTWAARVRTLLPYIAELRNKLSRGS